MGKLGRKLEGLAAALALGALATACGTSGAPSPTSAGPTPMRDPDIASIGRARQLAREILRPAPRRSPPAPGTEPITPFSDHHPPGWTDPRARPDPDEAHGDVWCNLGGPITSTVLERERGDDRRELTGDAAALQVFFEMLVPFEECVVDGSCEQPTLVANTRTARSLAYDPIVDPLPRDRIRVNAVVFRSQARAAGFADSPDYYRAFLGNLAHELGHFHHERARGADADMAAFRSTVGPELSAQINDSQWNELFADYRAGLLLARASVASQALETFFKRLSEPTPAANASHPAGHDRVVAVHAGWMAGGRPALREENLNVLEEALEP